jgi:hypothetical protein
MLWHSFYRKSKEERRENRRVCTGGMEVKASIEQSHIVLEQ